MRKDPIEPDGILSDPRLKPIISFSLMLTARSAPNCSEGLPTYFTKNYQLIGGFIIYEIEKI